MQYNNIFPVLVHLGVNIRVLPTTGMTLPFLSNGGSSIIGSSILAGIILNLTKKYLLKKKILITTGGSGGHIIPALNFYEHLKQNNEVFLTSDLRGLRFIDTKVYNNKIIDVPDIKKNIFKIPLNLFLFLISIIKSFFYLKEKKIDKIISTGGYMTFPHLYSIYIYKIKIIFIEPNMVLGHQIYFFLKQCKKSFCYSNFYKKIFLKYIHKLQIIYQF